MATQTARLALLRHTTADAFRVADYASNWERLDRQPGVWPCTSTSRPTTWAAQQAGQLIQETDTGLLWRWTGSAWARVAPSGLLGRGTRTADISSGSTTLVTAAAVTVAVPDGNRPVLVTVEGPGVTSSVGMTRLSLVRDGGQLATWLQPNAANTSTPLAYTTLDTPTAGSRVYSLQFAAEVGFGGASTLQAGANRALAISVVEV